MSIEIEKPQAIAITSFGFEPISMFSADSVDADDDVFDIAETIIIGKDGNFTGRTPTQSEFTQAWAMMD